MTYDTLDTLSQTCAERMVAQLHAFAEDCVPTRHDTQIGELAAPLWTREQLLTEYTRSMRRSLVLLVALETP